MTTSNGNGRGPGTTKLSAAVNESINQMLGGAHQGPELPKMEELLAVFTDAHGGTVSLAEEWARHLKLAAEKSPGSKFVLDHFRDVGRLLMKANESNQVNFDDMDQDELRQYVLDMVMQNVDPETLKG